MIIHKDFIDIWSWYDLICTQIHSNKYPNPQASNLTTAKYCPSSLALLEQEWHELPAIQCVALILAAPPWGAVCFAKSSCQQFSVSGGGGGGGVGFQIRSTGLKLKLLYAEVE